MRCVASTICWRLSPHPLRVTTALGAGHNIECLALCDKVLHYSLSKVEELRCRRERSGPQRTVANLCY